MQIVIIETIEFNENKCDDIVLIGEIISNRQDGTFCESISWDRTKYNAEENEVIKSVAHKSATYHRIFEKYDNEIRERILENSI